MTTVDKLLQAYDDGDLTRHELFVHLLLGLTPAQVDPLRARLRANGDCLAEFEAWLDDVAAGAQLSLGGEPAHLSEEALTAVVLWRNQTQPARYSRLAERIKRWI